MRLSTIEKYHELRAYFCSDCGVKVCTEDMNLRCIRSVIYLASTYSDILEGKFGTHNQAN